MIFPLLFSLLPFSFEDVACDWQDNWMLSGCRQTPCLAPCVHAVLSITGAVGRRFNSDVVQIELRSDPVTPRKSKSEVYCIVFLHTTLARGFKIECDIDYLSPLDEPRAPSSSLSN